MGIHSALIFKMSGQNTKLWNESDPLKVKLVGASEFQTVYTL